MAFCFLEFCILQIGKQIRKKHSAIFPNWVAEAFLSEVQRHFRIWNINGKKEMRGINTSYFTIFKSRGIFVFEKKKLVKVHDFQIEWTRICVCVHVFVCICMCTYLEGNKKYCYRLWCWDRVDAHMCMCTCICMYMYVYLFGGKHKILLQTVKFRSSGRAYVYW